MVEKPQWLDPFSPAGIRIATSKILTGMNYRLFYIADTRRRLFETYRELAIIARSHPCDDEMWRASIKQMLQCPKAEDTIARQWFLGLAVKTADNEGISPKDYPSVFDQIMDDIESGPSDIPERDMTMLLWSGAATLSIRGSQKSKIGKSLERSIAIAALTIIGLREDNGDFRTNIEADEEVERETDAEVKTPRGFVRMEVGLIGKGNPEVISDKVGRMERNGIVLYDTLPKRSTARQTAANRGVKLIQIRNNHPTEELRQHLLGLSVGVQDVPISMADVEQRVLDMPLTYFS